MGNWPTPGGPPPLQIVIEDFGESFRSPSDLSPSLTDNCAADWPLVGYASNRGRRAGLIPGPRNGQRGGGR